MRGSSDDRNDKQTAWKARQDATEQHTSAEADVFRAQSELRELEREMSQTTTDDATSAMDAGVICGIPQALKEALQQFSSEIGGQSVASVIVSQVLTPPLIAQAMSVQAVFRKITLERCLTITRE